MNIYLTMNHEEEKNYRKGNLHAILDSLNLIDGDLINCHQSTASCT